MTKVKVLGQTHRMTDTQNDRQAKNNIPPLLRRREHKNPRIHSKVIMIRKTIFTLIISLQQRIKKNFKCPLEPCPWSEQNCCCTWNIDNNLGLISFKSHYAWQSKYTGLKHVLGLYPYTKIWKTSKCPLHLNLEALHKVLHKTHRL